MQVFAAGFHHTCIIYDRPVLSRTITTRDGLTFTLNGGQAGHLCRACHSQVHHPSWHIAAVGVCFPCDASAAFYACTRARALITWGKGVVRPPQQHAALDCIRTCSGWFQPGGMGWAPACAAHRWLVMWHARMARVWVVLAECIICMMLCALLVVCMPAVCRASYDGRTALARGSDELCVVHRGS